MIRVIFCALVVLALSGCAGNCISIDGKYKDWSGGFTWCVDDTKSADASRVVLSNGETQLATLINEKEAIEITEKLSQVTGGTASVKASSVSNFAEFNKYLRLIMEQADDQKQNK